MKYRVSTFVALLALANLAVAQEREAPDQADQERPAVQQQDNESRTQTDATRRGGREAGQATATAGSLNHFVAASLIIANQEEIQLNQAAMDKIQNDQAKQFAQMMVQEHQQFVTKLQQIVPGELTGDLEFTSAPAGQEGANGQQRRRTPRGEGQGQSDQQNQQQNEGAQPDEGAQNLRERAQGAAGEAREAAQQAGAQARDAAQQAGAQARDAVQGRTRQSAAGADQTHLTAAVTRGAPLHQLLMIEREKAQQCLAISKQQLQQADPSEVDQVYLGQQVAAHVSMLAKLRALDGHVDGELQQLVSQGEKSTQQHLQKAEQIMKQISSSGGQRGAQNDAESDTTRDADSNQ